MAILKPDRVNDRFGRVTVVQGSERFRMTFEARKKRMSLRAVEADHVTRSDAVSYTMGQRDERIAVDFVMGKSGDSDIVLSGAQVIRSAESEFHPLGPDTV